MEEVGVTVSSYLWDDENSPLVIVFQERKNKKTKKKNQF